MTRPHLGWLFLRFCLFSLMAVGGAGALVPELHRQAVEVGHWMDSAEFASLFALAQATPGPNMLIATLIGWKVAGIPGAVVCTVGFCLPSASLALVVGGLWDRHRTSPWRRALERGLAPITLGLILGGGIHLAKAAGGGWALALVTAASAVLSWRSRLNPVVWLLGAAALGASGLLG